MQDREKKEEHREKNIGQEGRKGMVEINFRPACLA